jgi:uncharacterized protein YkwD
MKSVVVLFASVSFAALLAAGVSRVDPDHAQGAGGGYVRECGGGTVFLNEGEKRIFVLHNRIRRTHDLKPFCVHPSLERAARAHSEDMVDRDYFRHDTKGGKTFDERLQRYGYDSEGYGHYLVGENIAYGSDSRGEPESTMRRWMNSDGHRRNILDFEFRQIGIGTHTGDYRGLGVVSMYTADFGIRRR